jgi:hypothetical protein
VRSDEEGDRNVRLIVGALDRRIELELHGAHGAAVIDAVEVLAETVEGLGGIDPQAQAEEGDRRLVAFGYQIQREPALPVEARTQHRAGGLFVVQANLSMALASARRMAAASTERKRNPGGLMISRCPRTIGYGS